MRKQHDLTQEAVAEIIGVARNTYSMYEQGNRQMDYESLIKLADYYKVSLDYLFGRTDNPLHLESYSIDEIEFAVRSLNLYKDIKNKFA
nr:helix-turn-helix transcriptional regulator [Heyndrickxia sporothermodurans]